MIRQPLVCTSTRRVIFPSLHALAKSDEKEKKEMTNSVSDGDFLKQNEGCLALPRRNSLSDAPTSSSSTEPSLKLPTDPSKPASPVGTGSGQVRNQEHASNTEKKSKGSIHSSRKTATKAIPETVPTYPPDSLVIPPFKGKTTAVEPLYSPHLDIPPFKGKTKECAPVLQQENQHEEKENYSKEEEQKRQTYAAPVPPHRTPRRKPLKSLLRTRSGPSGVPPLTSLGDDDEGSESSEDTTDSENPKLCRSKSLKEVKSITFDPRVWVYEFERAREEFDVTWFTPKEMERFKKQALIRVYVHAANQEELIPTGTGRSVRRPIQIPTKAVFSSPALSMDEEHDEDLYLESEKDYYRKQMLQAGNRNMDATAR